MSSIGKCVCTMVSAILIAAMLAILISIIGTHFFTMARWRHSPVVIDADAELGVVDKSLKRQWHVIGSRTLHKDVSRLQDNTKKYNGEGLCHGTIAQQTYYPDDTRILNRLEEEKTILETIYYKLVGDFSMSERRLYRILRKHSTLEIIFYTLLKSFSIGERYLDRVVIVRTNCSRTNLCQTDTCAVVDGIAQCILSKKCEYEGENRCKPGTCAIHTGECTFTDITCDDNDPTTDEHCTTTSGRCQYTRNSN